VPTVGLVSPGAMGSAIARILAAGGASVVATVAGRSARTVAFASSAGIVQLPDLDGVVSEADVLLSVAPPDQALAIVEEVGAAALRTGARPLVADLNAIAPQTARQLESSLRAAGLELVDGSISGPPPRPGASTRIYLSGPRAAEIAALPLAGVDLRIVGPDVGTASAVKMCTASVYKGTAALLCHALLTAERLGVLDPVLDDLETAAPDLVAGAARRIASAAAKSGRYVGEMNEIASTQGTAGLPTALFEAMAQSYAALARSPLGREAPEAVSPERTLADVLAALAPEPPGPA
jgi:3-hydroxyisobutyrate dehydrogenase-like beta-hydroxyacid dehydrogenase